MINRFMNRLNLVVAANAYIKKAKDVKNEGLKQIMHFPTIRFSF